jgi:epoxide hydrolase-like predicted phosphatase
VGIAGRGRIVRRCPVGTLGVVTSPEPQPARPFDAVLFDFTGVLTSSPWEAMGKAGDADHDAVLEVLVGPYHEDTDHPWHRLERGELAILEFVTEVEVLAAERGMTLDMNTLKTLLGGLELHHVVIDRIRDLRAQGYLTALVTNNVREGSSHWRAMVPLDELFDVVVDSSEVGMRKPNPAIYLHTLAALGGVEPGRAVFLDDQPGNVAGAERAGLTAILVTGADQAVAALDEVLAG